MSAEQESIERACELYEARFGNLEEISHPEILFRPEFGALLYSALEAGRPLNQEGVSKVFPSLAWNW